MQCVLIAGTLRPATRLTRQSRRRGGSLVVCSAPKAVIFDLGKVLLDFDYSKSAHALSAACKASTPMEVILELFGHAEQPTGLLDPWGGRSLVELMERGQLGSRQFYDAVVDASGLDVDYPTFAVLYADIFTPMQTMIAQQQLLAHRGCPTYLLSNVSELHIADVRRRHPFVGTFNGLCLSYQVRSFKPEPEIYAAAENLAQLEGSNLLFIDDRQENAAAAAERGWHAIHHIDAASTLRQMQELGLPVVEP